MIVSPAPRTSTELPDGYAPFSSPTSTLTLGVSRRSASTPIDHAHSDRAVVQPKAVRRSSPDSMCFTYSVVPGPISSLAASASTP